MQFYITWHNSDQIYRVHTFCAFLEDTLYSFITNQNIKSQMKEQRKIWRPFTKMYAKYFEHKPRLQFSINNCFIYSGGPGPIALQNIEPGNHTNNNINSHFPCFKKIKFHNGHFRRVNVY